MGGKVWDNPEFNEKKTYFREMKEGDLRGYADIIGSEESSDEDEGSSGGGVRFGVGVGRG